MADTPYQRSWDEEDTYWRASYRTRPYASVNEYEYDYFRPGYQYGYEAAPPLRDADSPKIEATSAA